MDPLVAHLNAANRAYAKECARARRMNKWSHEVWEESLEIRVALALHIEAMRELVAAAAAPWFEIEGARRCTCYVLPHADDCGLLLGITKTGRLVYATETGCA